MSGIKAPKYTKPRKSKKRKDVVDATMYLQSEVIILWDNEKSRYYASKDYLILPRGMSYLGTAEQINDNPILCKQIFCDDTTSLPSLLSKWRRLLFDLNIKEKFQNWNVYSQKEIPDPQTPPEPVE